MTATVQTLPAGITVFERGWLSSNNILLQAVPGTGGGPCTLVDSGYASHSAQTVALLERALGAQPLELLLNTHLHSDHCGGNAALQQRFAGLHTAIPPGPAASVRAWDVHTLGYQATGQQCPQFRFDSLLQPGQDMALGAHRWQVHAAPGHDPHAVLLFEPVARILISADALWQHGFGVVFPELEGEQAFADVAATLALIARLAPQTVIPGHGGVFTDVDAALDRAQRRLERFVREPLQHTYYAAKVMLKFKLLEWQRLPLAQLVEWALQTSQYARLHSLHFASSGSLKEWIEALVADLVRSGAAERDGDWVLNCG